MSSLFDKFVSNKFEWARRNFGEAHGCAE